MKRSASPVRKRINVTLPEATIRLLDRVSAKGQRSEMIDRAIHKFVDETGRKNLRRRLREGYRRRAEEDLQLAAEWFHVDEEAWSPGDR
jgi:CopG family transcriptional regulator / antitoxin EndoAI